MSEAEKELLELKEKINELCQKMNTALIDIIGNENMVERKNQLLMEQNEAINFLKEVSDSTINRVIEGIKRYEEMTNSSINNK
jgi:hypothetical protein